MVLSVEVGEIIPENAHFFEILMQSIKTKIFALPDETILYTGHGEFTSVGYEQKFFTF